MNAYKIMLFIMIFSFCVSAVTYLNIYNTAGGIVETDRNFSTNRTVYTSFDAIWDIIGFDALTSVILGAIAGSLANWITGVPGDKAFLYSTFATFYLTKCGRAIAIFWSIGTYTSSSGSEAVSNAVYIGVIIFSFVVAISLFSFLLQLIGGPWYSME